MDTMRNGPASARVSALGIAALSLVALAAVLSTGCASRTLTITQDDYINRGMGTKPTGDPLEVAIVCVYPEDLKREENDRLRPDSGITAKEWFERQPGPGGSGRQPFRLPSNQIFLLTNEKKGLYGKKVGDALQGAVKQKKEVVIKGIRFNGWKLHKTNSVIYVFPCFIGPDLVDKVLPAKPAVFSPPGKYTSKLFCKIGSKDRTPDGQYIENTTERGVSGSRKEE